MGTHDDASKHHGILSARTALGFVILLGFVSLFSDMTYEGGRSMVGQYLKLLGAGAAAVGISAGAGEFLGYALRLVSGFISDKTGRYWDITMFGYFFQLFALPALALVASWELAVALIFAERIGKAIRNPTRDALLSYATSRTGRGFGFGLHEAMDQIGAFLGPLILSIILYIKARGAGGGTEVAGYQTAFAVLLIPAICAVLILAIARLLFPNPQELESRTPKISSRGYSKAYWWYLVAAGLIAAGYADFPIIAYHMKRTVLIPEHWIPVFYSVAMAVDAGAALVFGKLFDKRGIRVIPFIFAISAVFAPFVFYGGIPAVVTGIALWGIGMGAQESVMRAAVAEMVPAERRGTAFGMFHTGFGILWFLGSSVMGFLYDWNIAAVVAFSVTAQLAALPLFFRANYIRSRETG